MAQGTLKTQIENIIGSVFTSTLYDDWLVAGARTIVDVLKPEDLERHSTSVSVTSAGINATGYRIWKVVGGTNSNIAISREVGSESQVIDASNYSFYKATAFTPAYIIAAGTLKIYAGSTATSGILVGIAYPSAIDSSTQTEIVGVPENMHYAVVLYAAIQGRLKQMSDLNSTLHTAAASAISELSALSISELSLIPQLNNLETYLVTNEDIELAKGVIEDIGTRLANWQSNASARLKAINDAEFNKIQGQLATLKAHVEGYSNEAQALNLSMQQLQSEYHTLIDLYLGRTKSSQQGQA